MALGRAIGTGSEAEVKNAFAAATLALMAATVPAQQPVDSARRDALRKQADEARARNAREREEIQQGFASPSSATTPDPAAGQPSAVQICRAVIAAVMGRPVEIVNVMGETAGVVQLTYVRPSDQTTWKNRCRLTGSAAVLASDSGRWRDHPQDEKITFRTVGGEIVIRQQFSDGSSIEKRFSLKVL